MVIADKGKLIFSPLTILLIVILDQVTKTLALKFLPTVCNTGIAFGLGSEFLNQTVLRLLLLLVLFFLLRLFLARSSKPGITSDNLSIVALSLLFGGGMSNLIDRLTRGCVLDFIDLKIWPAFNLADAAITLGVGILIVSLLKDMSRK